MKHIVLTIRPDGSKGWKDFDTLAEAQAYVDSLPFFWCIYHLTGELKQAKDV